VLRPAGDGVTEEQQRYLGADEVARQVTPLRGGGVLWRY
jgi:hypothetical protein